MSTFPDIIIKTSNEIIETLKTNNEVYYIHQPPFNPMSIIENVIKANPDYTFLYFVNNVLDKHIVDCVIEDLAALNVADIYNPVYNPDIIVIGADEEQLEKRMKNIKTIRPLILINDSTYVSKTTSINKLKEKFKIEKVINLTLYERLSSADKSYIIQHKPPLINIDLNEVRNDNILIQGFNVNPRKYLEGGLNPSSIKSDLINTSYECKFINIIRNECNDNKCNKALIITKNKKESFRIKCLIDMSYINMACNLDADEYEDEQILITSSFLNINDINNPHDINIIMMAEGTCTKNNLYTVVTELQFPTSYKYNNQYKTLLVCDSPTAVKASLQPSVINVAEQIITSTCRNDIEPILFVCDVLGNAKYSELNDCHKAELIDCAHDYIYNNYKSRAEFTRDGIKPSFDTKLMVVDSFIRNYNDYNIISERFEIDYINEEAEQKLLLDNIARHINSIELPYYKFDGNQSNELISEIIISAMFSKYHRYNYSHAQLYRMINNDMNSENSFFKKVINVIIRNYRDNNPLEVIPTRTITSSKEISIPFKEIDIKKSDIISAKKCGMTYCNKPRQKTELTFMNYLENNQYVDWWVKNGDHGEKYFNVICEYNNTLCCFYPDWVIKLKSGKVLIVDTKDGMTLTENGLTHNKIEALKEYCKTKYSNVYCGIITSMGGEWLISNMNKEYEVDDKFSCFISLDELLKELSNG